jgi:thiol-disulfide isomerase/thioredoxin
MKQILQVLLTVLFAFVTNLAIAQYGNGPTIDSAAPVMNIKESLDKAYHPGIFDQKFMVIDFWATWCAPCIAGFPHFNALATKFEKDKRVVFATMTDEDRSKPELFFKRTGKELKGYRLIDNDGITMNGFKIFTIPTAVVIDDAGIVRWVGQTSDLRETKLDSLINKIPSLKVAAKPVLTVTPYLDPAVRALLNRSAFGVLLLKSTDTTQEQNASSSWATISGGDFTNIDIYRKKLLECIRFLTGTIEGPRFIVSKIEKGNFKIDLIYKPRKAVDSSYLGKYIPGKPNINYLLELLSKTFQFHLAIKPTIVAGYQLVAIDTNRLNVFSPIPAGPGKNTRASESDPVDGVVEIVNHSLDEITNTLETYLKVPIKNGTGIKRNFDLTLNVSSISNWRQW